MSLSVDVRKVVDVEVVRRAGVGSRMRPMVWVNVADQGEVCLDCGVLKQTHLEQER